MTSVFVIGRRRKGRPVGAVVRQVRRRIEREGLAVEARVVRRKRRLRTATSRAVDAGCRLVVCAGGDGTVREVATALAGTEVPLAIIPTGTGNFLARNLGLPRDVREAVNTAISGRRQKIDVGSVKIAGKVRDFTVACGVGFDATVMRRTTSRAKGRWGGLAYVANAIREAGTIRNVPHELTLDGVRSTTDAAQVFVANLGRIPPGHKVPGVQPTDGLLDVFVVRASGPIPALLAGWEAIRHARPGRPRGSGSRRLGRGRLFRTQAREIRIETKPARQVELDGNVVGTTPLEISVRPSALTVMVPGR